MKNILAILFTCCVLGLQAQVKADLEHARLMRAGRNTMPAAPSWMVRKGAEGLSSIQRPVGHIVDNNPDSITVSGALIGAVGEFSVGALVTADMLRPYVGCKIIGIRMAAAQSLGKTQLFLHPLQEGYISEEGITKSQRLYEGWNNVFFNGDTSWEIAEGETILVGFDYNETESMVQNQRGGLCMVGESNGNDFLLYGNFGSGEGWYAINNMGALCVQLIVDVSTLPEKALAMTYLDTGFRYKMPDENIELYVVAMNTGREELNGYTVSCQVDDNEPLLFHYDTILPEMGSDHQQPVIPIPGDITVGEHQLTVALLPEGESQPTGDSSSQTLDFYVYTQTVPRQKVYVEQYNSQNEYMASVVNPLINQVADNNDNMVLVNVYEKVSSLALPETDFLFDLYAYTLPSFTINRAYFPGEEYIAYDVNYYAEQYGPLVPAIIDDMVNQDMLSPAFATINLIPTLNEEGQLVVEVDGNMVDGAMDIFNNLAVTLLLTENNVVAPQLVRNPVTMKYTIQQDYVHQHVLRTYITSPLGHPVEVSGTAFSDLFTVDIDPSWNLDNMTLVGFLNRGLQEANDDNVLKMDVTNCNAVPLSGISGIVRVDDRGSTASELFNLNGVSISPDNVPPGIYILRKGASCHKIIVK